MENSYFKNSRRKEIPLLAMIFAGVTPAFASSSGSLPFNSTMNTLKDAISGPFLLAAAIIMIVITCLMLAFGEWGDGFKKIINMVMWLSIAFAATSFVTSMFGSGAIF